MAESDDAERSEEATPQRREDFRKRGQVAQTRELASVFTLIIGLLALWLLGRFFFEQLYQVFTKSFSDYVLMAAKNGDWFQAVRNATITGFLVIGPFAGILWIANAASTIVQIGILQNEEAIKFDLTRLDPIQGFKKIISMRSLVEGLKAIIKITAVVALVYHMLKSDIKTIPLLSTYEIPALIMYIGNIVFKLFASVGGFMFGLSIVDYLFQRWELEKQMRMTKQEVKEEIKSREGDPLIRARVRKLQRELASRRMMDDVKKAEVIITNPTHIAVALQYTKDLVAPRVVAKGAGDIAEKIKQIAKEHKIPIVENKPLARTIFKTLKLGQVIPRELYTAVAEVLSYIFRLKKRSWGN
jgi:flagellar biosynthetic protein FlhB